jgi:hypothetical protein
LVPDKIPPSTPAHVTYQKLSSPVLKWNASTDNKGLLGYNVYLNDKRIGFTPLTYWYMPSTISTNGGISVRSVDLQGNESKPGKASIY